MTQSLNQLLLAYLPLVIFIGVAAVIGLALLLSAFVVAYKQADPEKLSAYECGFNAFDDARMKFDVRFYLVAILFIIFDLEVSFLFPWAVAFDKLGLEYVPSYGNFVMVRVGSDDGAGARVNLDLLKQGVIVRPVGNYGLPQWLRVTIGLPAENEAFISALEKTLATV